MQVPSYKHILFKSHLKEEIFDQLSKLSFGTAPFILDISHLQDEDSAIVNIESYVKQNFVPLFPYPICIISNVTNFIGKIEIFSHINQCPNFFIQKQKGLSIKEQQVLKKLELKQKKFLAIEDDSYKESIKQYANEHKKIFDLTLEGDFLEALLENLKLNE